MKKAFIILLLIFFCFKMSTAQQPIIALSQAGYRPNSPKMVTLVSKPGINLPDSIPFYIHQAGSNLPRKKEISGIWKQAPYSYPYHIAEGSYGEINLSMYDYKGWLVKQPSRWGVVWQSEFSEFQKPGLYQLETEHGFSLPFPVDKDVYIKILRGYLHYLYSQRSAYDIPGIRRAEHLDDGNLDNGGGYHPAAGGWYNAGDLRKWLSLTLFNLEALYHLYQYGPESFRPDIIAEVQWGNRYFHQMITQEGQVYEDVAGGDLRGNFKYEEGWWTENHPGCIANNAGNYLTDNVPNSGDERTIRTTYNPFVQLAFVKNQALVSTFMPALDATKSLYLAEKAWKYAREKEHDQRTIFVVEELDAALELKNAGSNLITTEIIDELLQEVLNRQDKGTTGLSHYFLEKDGIDAYRSVAFSCLPATVLLRALELDLINQAKKESVKNALNGYLNDFLLKDAESNPYGLTPYGAYIKKPHPEQQLFRDAGRNRGVRSFIHPFNEQFMVHGTNGVVMNQAYLLAKAGYMFNNKNWQQHGERLLQWTTGHNPEGLSLIYGIGAKSPVPFTMFTMNIPYAALNGYIGTTDDKPYLETSNAMGWNTQEIWDIPFQYASGAAVFLNIANNQNEIK